MKYFRNPSAAGKRSQQVQAENRMAGPAPEYPPIFDPDQMYKRITVESFWLDGHVETKVIELYPVKRGRRDQYRATLNGQPWHDKISLTQVFAELRKWR
jgi:hypothetical protein